MTEHQETPAIEEESPKADIQTRIAEKVRSDSSELARLTSIKTIEALFTDDDPDVRFEDMMADPEFADVKWVTSPIGHAYFYSDQSMTPDQATEESVLESSLVSISHQVRSDSKEIALTPMEAVVTLLPEELSESLDLVVDRLGESPQYQDILKVVGPTGMEYLHSEQHISPSYARLLARVDANDPLAMMAETIREDSRVYPRVTSLDSFRQEVFNIDPSELDGYVERLLASEDYSDIQKTVVSNGAVYLFSDRHLHPKLAARQAEDDELGDELNP